MEPDAEPDYRTYSLPGEPVPPRPKPSGEGTVIGHNGVRYVYQPF